MKVVTLDDSQINALRQLPTALAAFPLLHMTLPAAPRRCCSKRPAPPRPNHQAIKHAITQLSGPEKLRFKLLIKADAVRIVYLLNGKRQLVSF